MQTTITLAGDSKLTVRVTRGARLTAALATATALLSACGTATNAPAASSSPSLRSFSDPQAACDWLLGDVGVGAPYVETQGGAEGCGVNVSGQSNVQGATGNPRFVVNWAVCDTPPTETYFSQSGPFPDYAGNEAQVTNEPEKVSGFVGTTQSILWQTASGMGGPPPPSFAFYGVNGNHYVIVKDWAYSPDGSADAFDALLAQVLPKITAADTPRGILGSPCN